MRPFFNSFPHQSQQQGFQSNSAMQNQSNNNNMFMMQPHMGIFNPQLPIPLSNNNNSSVMSLLNNVGLMNGTNQILPAQNNHLGFPQCGPIFPNLNNASVFPQLPAQFSNPLQNPNQPNWLNLPQQNNLGLINGQQQQQQQQQQLLLQNQLQNVAQLLNVIPNLSQFVSGAQTMGCLNPTNVPNQQFGFMKPNQMQQQANQSQQNRTDLNASMQLASAATSQVVGDPSFRRPMGDPGKNGQNVNNFSGRNGKRDSKWRFQKSKFQQCRFHQADNVERKFASTNGHQKKGKDTEWSAKFPHFNSATLDKQKRRSLALTYTEQEIRQWREERKKYYPTKANIKKKLSGKGADSEVAKLRGEQLKEILAKQAELGVEVAEIPSHYLVGSENTVNGREGNNRLSNKRGRHEMRQNKRGRSGKRDRFNKKRRSTNEESHNGTSCYKSSPNLLQKLLSADIRKDKSRLLQVFRFMVMNSFFKDWPEKPLKFPLVVVRDGLPEGEIVQDRPLLVGKDHIEVCSKTMIPGIVDGDGDRKNNGDGGVDHGNHYENDDDTENNNHNNADGDSESDDDDDKKQDTGVSQAALYAKEKADIGEEIVRNEEEEGEIID